MNPLERPVIVVGPPASGQVAMRECLLTAPGAWRVDSLVDLIATVTDADGRTAPTPEDAAAIRSALETAYAEQAEAALPGATPRLVAADGALVDRVPLLAAVLPDARFVYLHRDPAEAVPDAAAEATAEEWAESAARAQADLAALADDRWTRVETDDLVTRPEEAVQELFTLLDLGWHSRASAPWRTIARHTGRGGEQSEAAASDRGLGEVLRRARSSLLVSTYQSNRLMVLRHDSGALGVHLRSYDRPMGIARTPSGFALGTRSSVWDLRDFPAVGEALEPRGRHDACFVPRNSHVTGDIAVHELELGTDGLWVVATKFSCLATLDTDHSFVPRWKPSFITALAAEDRCHLNGMALVDGRPRYVTALGTTDTPGGWRADRSTGGVVLDVPSSEVVVAGLSMPHSPRWHDGRLWVLESGRGRLSVCDLATGTTEPVVELPGFTRGLRFSGTTAYVATSQIRETATFGGLPIADLPRRECGVWAIDTTTGRVLGSVTFENRIEEIFDVEVLEGRRFPEVAELDDELVRESWFVPQPR